METMVSNEIGWIHLIASCFALLFGTFVLWAKKGTGRHQIAGYFYLISMSVLLITGFMIYRMFQAWGFFHYLSLLSAITLVLGMVPIWIKTPKNGWIYFHFSFMYWSVIGLYAAFAAEVLVRVPETPFFGMVGLAIGTIILVGGVVFKIRKSSWIKEFVNR